MKLSSLLLFGQIILWTSCSSFPVDIPTNTAWATKDMERARGTIRIISVSVERSGEWGSLEKEIRELLPLLFYEESYLVVSPSARADFTGEVVVREREYADGWRTRRSLSAELRLWAGEEFEPLPLSIGRSLIQGRQSLGSSKTLTNILRRVVRNAARGLPEVN